MQIFFILLSAFLLANLHRYPLINTQKYYEVCYCDPQKALPCVETRRLSYLYRSSGLGCSLVKDRRKNKKSKFMYIWGAAISDPFNLSQPPMAVQPLSMM